MIVHALTPVTRPENLAPVAESLAAAGRNAPAVRLDWHLAFDLDRRHVGGWRLRNEMLDRIGDGWVWLLDDDTVAHPRVLERLLAVAESATGLVFSQDGRPPGFPPAVADPERLRNGDLRGELRDGDSVFDAGMAIIRRDLVGDYRFREHRAADGFYFDVVIVGAPDVVYLDEVLCHYNALRPGEWG